MKEWTAHKPPESNGYWYVMDGEGRNVATCFADDAGETAKMIVEAVNKLLKECATK